MLVRARIISVSSITFTLLACGSSPPKPAQPPGADKNGSAQGSASAHSEALGESKVAAKNSCPQGMAFVPGTETPGMSKDSFCLDITEVTVDAYAACVKSGKCDAKDAGSEFREGEAHRSLPSKACNWGVQGRGDHPMNCVSLDWADAYCASIGKRLPATEEWETAARGGAEKRNFPWGAEPPTDHMCWSGTTAGGKRVRRKETCKVGSTPRDVGPYGHMDLGGNVREWTASYIREAPGVARSIPTASEVGRAWSDSYVGSQLIGGMYSGDDPTARSTDRGFRCAK